MAGIAANRGVDAALAPFQLPDQQRQVCFFDGTVFELRLQMAVRFVVFGNQDDAGCVFIQPVDDARPLYSAHPF